MVWFYGLILIGLLFLLFEIFFVPGTTIVGLVGLALAGFGVYQLYINYGATSGTIGLVISLGGFLTLIIIGFRRRSWEKYAIDDSLQGRTNVIQPDEVAIGDRGKAVSAIKPAGKARINGINHEVQAYSDFLDEGEVVIVSKIQGKTIYVRRENPESN